MIGEDGYTCTREGLQQAKIDFAWYMSSILDRELPRISVEEMERIRLGHLKLEAFQQFIKRHETPGMSHPKPTPGFGGVNMGYLPEPTPPRENADHPPPQPDIGPGSGSWPLIDYPRGIKRPDDWPAPPEFEIPGPKRRKLWPFGRSKLAKPDRKAD
jgi:hypothetical protein